MNREKLANLVNIKWRDGMYGDKFGSFMTKECTATISLATKQVIDKGVYEMHEDEIKPYIEEQCIERICYDLENVFFDNKQEVACKLREMAINIADYNAYMPRPIRYKGEPLENVILNLVDELDV